MRFAVAIAVRVPSLPRTRSGDPLVAWGSSSRAAARLSVG